MVTTICYAMVYAGSILMVYCIYRYIMFSRNLRTQGGWNNEGRILYIPTLLLVMFLLGYLAVAIFGTPDPVVAAILFGGSLFVFFMILFLQKVTDRVYENEQLRADLKTAEESSQAKTAFLSVMSHEIRTPLNGIIGLNNMARRAPELHDDTRGTLDKLDASAQHLLSLINEILDMNRISAGLVTLSEEAFSLSDLIDQVNIMIKNQCDDKGLEYRVNVDPDMDAHYRGDPTKVRQVLVNILGNAVKFTPAPGTVELTVRQTASYEDHRTIRFAIADTGIGMDESFLPNLFNAFVQEDSSTTNRYGGSGLGMAITKNLVDMMNGDIQVASKKGEGTTFTVTISLAACDENDAAVADGQAGASGQDADEGAEASLKGLHVLVAEDVELNAEILIDLLSLEDITADHALNGKETVQLFAQSAPGFYDAVLMDVRMPEMDGLQASAAIRKLDHPDAATIPILAMTANAFDEDVQRSLQAGMNAHLSKPIDPDLLFDTLRTYAAKQ